MTTELLYMQLIEDELLFTNNIKRIYEKLIEYPTVFYITEDGVRFLKELLFELSTEKNAVTISELAELLAVSEIDEKVNETYQKLKHIKGLKLNTLADSLSNEFKKVNLVIKESNYIEFLEKKTGVLFPVVLLCL